MCDYCGCRANPPIAELSEEHDRIRDLCYELRGAATAGDHTGASAVVAALVAALGPHTAKEEAGLFTELRAVWEADDRIGTLTAEHREVEADLAAVAAGAEGWPALAKRAVRRLADHVVDEEVDLFPYAMYELTGEQWARVADVHARSGPHEAASAGPQAGAR